MKKLLSLAALTLLAACGSDSPTRPSPPIPKVAGRYTGWNIWLVQWNRTNDGVSGSFTCSGTVTLSQSELPGAAAAALSGFAVVGSPCPPQSFDLTGSVGADGTIRFESGGPKPYQGQCPAAENVTYTGVVANKTLSVRGSANLDCPGPGEGPHRFDYIVSARQDGSYY